MTDESESKSWSKEYVEHLRTVHFALITTAAALLVLSLSTKSYNPAKALAQIEEIESLKKIWSPSWIWNNWGKQHSTTEILKKTTTELLLDEHPISAVVTATSTPKLKKNAAFWLKTADRDGKAESRIFFYTRRTPEEFIVDLGIEASLLEIPDTVAGIRVWWNDLGKPQLGIRVRGVDRTGCRVLIGSNMERSSDALVGYPVPKLADCLLMAYWDGFDHVDRTLKSSLFLSNTNFPRIGKRTTGFLSGYDEISGASFSADITSIDAFKLNQETARVKFPDWTSGSFEESFHDLSKATEDQGLDYLELADVRERLIVDSSKGGEVFETFGVKIPAPGVARWGTVLLLVIQLYFFLYLKQRAGRLQTNSAGWDVPWIGMDSSVWGRVIFLTTTLTPVIVIFLLSYETHFAIKIGTDKTILRFWHWISEPWLLLTLALSLTFSYYSWKFRPAVESGPVSNLDPASNKRESDAGTGKP